MFTQQEWLEADGFGGFASGTASSIRTRRYHALLLAASTPPAGRMTLVNGFDAWVQTPNGRFMLTSQCYAPGVLAGEGAQCIESFEANPWPTWRFRLEDGTLIQHEIIARKGSPTVLVTWKRIESADTEHVVPPLGGSVKLFVRPFLSGRDYHSLHHKNNEFNFEPQQCGQNLIWNPYPGLPSIISFTNGSYQHDPQWYRNFLYENERARGLDHIEDLASPGVFEFDLAADEALWLLSTEDSADEFENPLLRALNLRISEHSRRQKFSPLQQAADSYLVQGARGQTIIAGYPWFADWGRDTFIAIRGLCLANDRLNEAGEILASWAASVSEGMLPNRFPDQGQQPEYNSVDASLWYVIAVGEYIDQLRARDLTDPRANQLQSAIKQILQGYSAGTRFGIRMDSDGLLACGQSGVQLTWMDAKVGDWVVTPRIGKPVEIQALWINALAIGARLDRSWKKPYKRALDSFQNCFWNPERGYLYDVIDEDHEPRARDASLRPNQILAIGGLPIPLLEGERARAVVDAVEQHLLTPAGLRSLAPFEPAYAPKYQGGVRERDAAYHQGTVWPWLIGPFAEAWIRVRGETDAAKREARKRFLTPLLTSSGHIAEIADAEPPHTPRGCPFQAWSVGEAIRLDRLTQISTRK
jgi:predicted glycogen debranching enzyme